MGATDPGGRAREGDFATAETTAEVTAEADSADGVPVAAVVAPAAVAPAVAVPAPVAESAPVVRPVGPVPGAPGAMPPVPPPPPGYRPGPGPAFAPVPVAEGKSRSRMGVYVSLAVVGFLATVAGTAGTVVALGSPGGGSVQAAAPVLTATPSPPVTTAPATTAPVVVPTVAPAPTAVVHGSVSDGTHSGDLRFFLLPIPDGAQPINDATGTLESLGAISQEMADPSQGLAELKSWNCTGGAVRQYRSSDGTLTIRTELLKFSDSGDAGGWFSGLHFDNGTAFSIPGVDNSNGWAFDPSGAATYGRITGVGYSGDVMYEIDIDGQGKVDHALLAPLMRREQQLLSTGH